MSARVFMLENVLVNLSIPFRSIQQTPWPFQAVRVKVKFDHLGMALIIVTGVRNSWLVREMIASLILSI